MPENVYVGVITRDRPESIEKLLASLERQSYLNFSVLLVENNREKTLSAIVQNITLPVEYELEPEPGIPFARNKVLDMACRYQADFLALIDDDMVAAEQWLEEHLRYMNEYGCDVLSGMVEICPVHAGGKSYLSELFEKNKREGERLPYCSSDNVALSRSVLHSGQRFDESRPFKGGTDTIYFNALHEQGCEIRFSNHPLAYERIGKDRLNLSYLRRRYIRDGETFAAMLKKNRKRSWVRLVALRTVKTFGSILLHLGKAIYNGNHMLYAYLKCFFIMGLLFQKTGFKGGEYRHR